MKAPFSSYLNSITPFLRTILSELSREYEYVSILSTDSVGFRLALSQHSKQVSGSNMTTERGSVVRVCKDGQYSEYAFNEPDLSDPDKSLKKIRDALAAQQALLSATGTKTYTTGILKDEPLELFVEKETVQLPEKENLGTLVEELVQLSDEGMRMIPSAVDCRINASSTHISKLFLSRNRFLRQSYVYTEGTIIALSPNESVT